MLRAFRGVGLLAGLLGSVAGVASSSVALWVGCGAALPGAGLALPLAARVDDVSAMGAAACEVVRRPMRVAEAEEDGAEEREDEEDAEDGGGAEGDLALACGLLVVLEIGFVVVAAVHGSFLLLSSLVYWAGKDSSGAKPSFFRSVMARLKPRSFRSSLVRSIVCGVLRQCFVEQVHELHGKREDDGGVLLDTDLGEGLEVAELEGHGLGGHEGGGVDQLGGGVELAFGVDDLGAALRARPRPAWPWRGACSRACRPA